MKVNVHAHVFNFQSILTKETILVLKHRLTGQNLPPAVRDLLLRYLRKKRGKNKEPISIEDFQKRIRELGLLERVVPGSMLDAFDEIIEMPESAGSRAVFMSTLRSAVAGRFRRQDHGVLNAMEWLRIGLMKSIDEVTDDLMTHLDDDDVAVLLPMDIIDRKAPKYELELFIRQLEDTTGQALRYPGRAIPFGMVNPNREDAFTLFKKAADEGSVAGLKLYPALGYPVWEGQVKRALEYCNEMALPVLLHCNDQGFRKSPEDAKYGRPDHWIPVLNALSDLKVCFGHFGGDQENDKPVWTAESLPADSWAGQILDLMRCFPGRVYADVSYHAGQFKSEEAASNYRRNLKEKLRKPQIRTQVLWGTDYHLLRIDATDTDYTTGFREWLGEEDFNQIASTNGRRFLGLPDESHEASEGISRHVGWLHENRARAVFGTPAAWLQHHPQGKQIEGGPGIEKAVWDRNNVLHVALFRVLWYGDPSHLSRGAKEQIERKTDSPEAAFEKVGRVPMRDMVFHRDVLGSASDRRERINSFIGMLKLWLDNDRRLERRHTDNDELYRKVQEVCGNPEHTMPKLAEVLALFYQSTDTLE